MIFVYYLAHNSTNLSGSFTVVIYTNRHMRGVLRVIKKKYIFVG